MSIWTALSGTFGKAVGRFERRDEREFLPAALEVVETPASPTGRALGYIIVVFFAIAVVWAFFGRVDVIATAPGRVLPAGEVKVIQPVDTGVVRAIHVQDGDHVKAGQLLIELDPTQTEADSRRVDTDLAQANLDVARLTALKTAIETHRAPYLVPPKDADPARVAESRAAMQAQADQLASKLADLSQQISQKDAEGGEVTAQIDKIKASLPLLEEKVRIQEDLEKRGYGTKLALIEAQQQLSEARHELQAQTKRLAQVGAARLALAKQQNEARSQYASEVLSDLRKAQEQQNELSQELIKAQHKTTQTELRSPIDGVVDQLAVHTLRGVVTPAQHLMIVVPDSQNLTIQARLANRDIGFVHAGQTAKVKIETFNFTRYGLIDGKVVDVSKDVVYETDRPAEAPQPNAAAGDAKANSPAYVARIALSRTSMMVDGKPKPLQPGMAITAEIRTGSRSIIDFLLSPIAKKVQETGHER
jgi:hemolysin D